jgi:long-chain acyl-CoA synthetase
MLQDSPTPDSSFSMMKQERANFKRPADYSSAQSLPEIWPLAAKRFEKVVALKDPHAKPEVVLTYAQLYQQIQQFAAGLQALGITPEYDNTGIPTRVALFADNSPRWMIADQGIMMRGS